MRDRVERVTRPGSVATRFVRRPRGDDGRPVVRHLLRIVLSALLLGVTSPSAADVTVTDFLDREVRLDEPAKRIVALAPHLVENLYSAGVGDRLVGVVARSDYPEAAKQLPQVGGYSNVNMEAVVALAPDLVVAWASGEGASKASLERLRALDIPVYVAEPRRLAGIARTIVDLGKLGGSPSYARAVAAEFRERLTSLRARYADREPVSIFYQVWDDPLQTLGSGQFVGHVIRLCGGRNVFSDASTLAPKISLEAVLARDPEAIVASGTGSQRPDWLDDWKQWPGLQAVEKGNLYFVPPDIIQRPTVRILDGAERLCEQLQRVRDS